MNRVYAEIFSAADVSGKYDLAYDFRELNVGVRFVTKRKNGTMVYWVKDGHQSARCEQDDAHRANVGGTFEFSPDDEVFMEG
jgi:hypothetical protein